MPADVLIRPESPGIDRSGCGAKRHGTAGAYARDSCRCDDAREDSRIYRRRLRRTGTQRTVVPAFRVQRRIRALWRAGHTSEDIAAHSDGLLTWHTVRDAARVQRRGRRRGHQYANESTLAGLLVAYAKLKDLPGGSVSTAARARAAQYPPPSAWPGRSIDDPDAQPVMPVDEDPAAQVDEVKVYEVLHGHRPPGVLDDGLERVTFAVAYLLGRDEDGAPHTTSGLLAVLGCSGVVAARYGDWRRAVAPAARVRGLTGRWSVWTDLAELAGLVAAERDRRRYARIVAVHAVAGLLARDGVYPTVRAVLVAAHAGGWRSWLYRIPGPIVEALPGATAA